jgi:hypothetical protein
MPAPFRTRRCCRHTPASQWLPQHSPALRCRIEHWFPGGIWGRSGSWLRKLLPSDTTDAPSDGCDQQLLWPACHPRGMAAAGAPITACTSTSRGCGLAARWRHVCPASHPTYIHPSPTAAPPSLQHVECFTQESSQSCRPSTLVTLHDVSPHTRAAAINVKSLLG